MKHFLIRLITLLFQIFRCIYTYRINERLKVIFGAFYSLWVNLELGSVGEHSSFAWPLLLQGGGQRRIRIGSHTSFGHHCVLGCWEKYLSSEGIEYYEPEIIIGDHCSIGSYCHITAINKITIGDGLLTGRFVYIGDNSHGSLSLDEGHILPIHRKLQSKGEVVIGNNVWIGDKATVLAGVHIGDNVIIGANSVVTKDVPSNCMAAGVPTIIIKQLLENNRYESNKRIH